jgi:hypothetical protein
MLIRFTTSVLRKIVLNRNEIFLTMSSDRDLEHADGRRYDIYREIFNFVDLFTANHAPHAAKR